MARRKRYLEDDGDSDSNVSSEDEGLDDLRFETDPDKRAERELFEDPYKRKRRRTGGAEDAIYGVFAEDSDEEAEGFGGRKKKVPQRRSDWTKAPSFVSGDKKDKRESPVNDESVEMDEDAEANSNGEAEEKGSSEDEMSTSTGTPGPVPRVHFDDDEDEMESKPTFGGIGLKGKTGEEVAESAPAFSSGGIGFGKGGIGSAKGGIGSAKGGIGSSTKPTPAAAIVKENLPSAFGTTRPQRSFLRGEGGSNPNSRPGTPLNPEERAHFSKLEGSFGARMLSKMGWQAGSGLGAEGAGIATPVEVKLRPTKMGIAFKGFKEKTAQSKAEARRRGEVVSDDEEAPKRRGKGKEREKAAREEAWKKPKKSKVKVSHKTYEEILAEAGGEAQPSGVGIIIDATGAAPREVASLTDVSISSWTPTGDSTRIPEVRHNLRLIADACKVDLDGLAREARAIEDRRKWVEREDPRLRRKVEDEAELIERLQAVHLVVDDINSKSRELAMSDYEPSLDVFADPVEKLVSEFGTEYSKYNVDEIVVAAIVPTFRRMMATWQPLKEPDAFTSTLRRWRKALKINSEEEKPEMTVDVFGSSSTFIESRRPTPPMTPYESLLWNIWLPKIRSTINNDWSPTDPHPAVRLYEAWSDLLPPFIKDNVLDQLVLPKVSAAVSSWSARDHTVSLRTIVFPWLPHVGLRMDTYMDEARRKIKSVLRSWSTKDKMVEDLLSWRDVFDAADWDNMMLKYVVPKLGALLRDDFRVNPRNQNMQPLEKVLQWADVIRPTIFGQLLETEFFPKWLEVLHFWLVQPSVNFEEVAQWYSFWKSAFPEGVRRIPAVDQGFTKGLQLMNQAVELGPDAPKKLPKPQFARSGTPEQQTTAPKAPPRPLPSRTHEITFRSIVEEFVAAHNLLFMPAGKVHEKSRMPLFRVSRTADGKGGILVYLLDDAVWLVDGDDYRAISLEDMVLRATKP